MRYWLMKSEPETYSIDDLKREGVSSWDGVRNYQARNFMRDEMRVGDRVLFYHSNARPPGVVGVAEVCSTPYPDHTARDKKSPYFDVKATEENPIWMMVDIKFVKKFSEMVSLDEMRQMPEVQDMILLKKGQRLSVQPIEKKHYTAIVKRGG
ncbi:MAG: EVE domain-containing protein [Chlamydiales bacterium]|nr:EVE domain-containing protein [Chlamydiia bacterium]MCP5508256.1 EVE domain-containing protein [Chlamydiales bacterium]